MGILYDKVKSKSTISSSLSGATGGSLYERAQKNALGTQSDASISPNVIETVKEPSFISKSIDSIKGLVRGEVNPMDVVKGIPEASKDIGVGFAKTFIPAVTNFTKTTGSILGEGLAYAIDPNVRQQYEAGNLDILPTITETTPAKLAKATIAAGIETAVFKAVPPTIKMGWKARGGIGVLQGLGFAVTEGLAKDKTAEEIIDSLPQYGVMAGAIEIAAPWLLPILKKDIGAVPSSLKNVFKGIEKESSNLEKKIGVSADTEIHRVPITTPNSRYEAYLKSQGYEPYIPESQLPSIDIGNKQIPKGELPEIQIGDEALKTSKSVGDFKIVPEKQPVFKEAPSKPVSPEPIISSETLPIEETRITKVPREQLPVNIEEGQTRVSKLEARVKNKLEGINPARAEEEGIATYKQMNKADQINRASKFAEESPEEAMAVLRGEKPAPEGLLHNSIAIAMEEKAASSADANLAVKLASLRSTRAGQEISILTEADPTNPISQIQEIIKARVGKATRVIKDGNVQQAVKSEISAGKEVIKQSRLKIQEAESLLERILC